MGDYPFPATYLPQRYSSSPSTIEAEVKRCNARAKDWRLQMALLTYSY
jgi:hypothetical protein